jgi:hypothetical protein
MPKPRKLSAAVIITAFDRSIAIWVTVGRRPRVPRCVATQACARPQPGKAPDADRRRGDQP